MLILGIQIDPPYLRTALIQKNRSGIEIQTLKTFPLSQAEDVKQLYTKNFKGRTATGISANELFVRSIELKVGNQRHVEEAVAFQADATSHFKPEEVITVPILNKKGQDLTEAHLFTTPRESLRSLLLEVGKFEIDPDGISSVPTALCRLIQWKLPHLAECLIIDLASSEITCVWMQNGQLKKTHSIAGGVESLLFSLWEDRKKILLQKEMEGAAKQIDLLLLKPHLNPLLTFKINKLRQDLAKSIHSLHRESKLNLPLIFTGRTDAFSHLTEYLAEDFKEIVSFESIGSLTLEEQKYAVALGFCIEQTAPKALQFRREEFFPQKNWKRMGLYGLTLLTASFLFATALFGFGMHAGHLRKFQMIESLQSFLDKWDPALKRKILLQTFDIDEKIDAWVSAVEAHDKEYPYIPQAPRVSEVLAWLSSHPLLNSLKEENDPIQLKEFKYQLLQFPKIDSPKDSYQAKVEIEFQLNGSIHARKFHDALLKGDEMVDPKSEVIWETLAHGYRTSFFLKNRRSHDS
ncbi:MAG: hypothetical protein V4487_09190 [Chlamydiota bacterium]